MENKNKKFEAEYVNTETSQPELKNADPIQPEEIGLNNKNDGAMGSGASEKIHIHIDNGPEKVHFKGREYIEDKAPKTLKAIDQIFYDWKNEGDFKNIDLGIPVADTILGLGLRRAKKVEKKLEEKGVFMMAQVGIEYAKSKLKLKK